MLAFLQDALSPDERRDFERHLDACDECLELVTLASQSSVVAPRGPLVRAIVRPPGPGSGALPPGTLIGRYEIAEPLGRGAMGTVYAARDTRLGRRVAIKLVAPALARDRAWQHRLLREAQALARITQPNVLTVYDTGAFDDAVFLAAELIEGDTLDVWLARPRRWRQIVDVFLQAARGLEAAHAVGVVHRDFKPSNAMVGRDGRVRVFDFGVARFVDAAGPCGELAGTPLYMAPEQLRGDAADARADQYALCVALDEALSGEHPAPRAGAPRPPPRVIGRPPRWLRDVLHRGLAPEPDQRFATLGALRAAVERGLGRRRRWLAAGIAALAVSAAAATGALAYQRGSRAPVDRCSGSALAAWSLPRRLHVAAALRATGLPHAAAVAGRVERALDQFAAGWQRHTRDACLAAAAGDAPAPTALAAGRTACLDRGRIAFAAVADRFATADRALVARADHLLAGLPDLALCARSDDAWPDEPAARARFVGQLTELARIASLADAGQLGAAARDVAALVRTAGALGSRRAEADAAYLAGHIAGLRGELDPAARQIERALWLAEAAHHDELVATALDELLWLVGVRLGRPRDALRFAAFARAAAARLGVPARLRAAHAIAGVQIAAGDRPAAAAELGDALRLAATAASPDDAPIAAATAELAGLQAWLAARR